MTSTRLCVLKGHSQAVLCCETAATQSLLASGSEDGTICLQDLRSNSLIHRLEASKDEAVTSVAFRPDDQHQIWCSAGNSVCCFDTRQTGSSALLQRRACTSAEINCIALSVDGNTIAAVDDDGQTSCRLSRLVAGMTTSAAALYIAGRNPCKAVDHCPSAAVITGGLDCKVIQWDTSARSMLSARHTGNEGTQSEAKVCNPPMVHGLAVPATDEAPAAHLMAAACGDGHIRIYDLEKVTSSNSATRARQRRPVCVLGQDSTSHHSAATCVRFLDSSAQRLISGGNDRQLQLWSWQADSGTLLASWLLKRKVNAMVFHEDHIYVGDTSKHISVYAMSQQGSVASNEA